MTLKACARWAASVSPPPSRIRRLRSPRGDGVGHLGHLCDRSKTETEEPPGGGRERREDEDGADADRDASADGRSIRPVEGQGDQGSRPVVAP